MEFWAIHSLRLDAKVDRDAILVPDDPDVSTSTKARYRRSKAGMGLPTSGSFTNGGTSARGDAHAQLAELSARDVLTPMEETSSIGSFELVPVRASAVLPGMGETDVDGDWGLLRDGERTDSYRAALATHGVAGSMPLVYSAIRVGEEHSKEAPPSPSHSMDSGVLLNETEPPALLDVRGLSEAHPAMAQLDTESRALVLKLHKEMLFWRRVSFTTSTLLIFGGFVISSVFMGSTSRTRQERWLIGLAEFIILSVLISVPLLLLVLAFRRQFKMRSLRQRVGEMEWQRLKEDAKAQTTSTLATMAKTLIAIEIGRALRSHFDIFIL